LNNSPTRGQQTLPQPTIRQQSTQDKKTGQENHEARGDPGDPVKRSTVPMFTHQVFTTGEAQHEDENKREQNAVGDLGEQYDRDLPGLAKNEHSQRSGNDQDGVQPIEGGRFVHAFVDARFQSQSLAYGVSRG
jgi:hypothetical protein